MHSATDVIKAMMAGARVAMMTSALLKKGINYIDTVITETLIWMDQLEYSSIRQMEGSMSRRSAGKTAFDRANYMKVLSCTRSGKGIGGDRDALPRDGRDTSTCRG